jgi:hypothetical protein
MEELENAIKVDLPSGPGGEPPQTPYGLAASPSVSNVLLTWNSSPGSTSYTIRRSTGSQDPWLIIAMNVAELAWTDTDVQPGKTYHYVVSGVNDTGESGNSDEVVASIAGGEAAPAVNPAAVVVPAPDAAAPAVPPLPAEPTAPTAAAPANSNGDHLKEPSIPEEKGQTAPTPEVKPST